MNKLSGIMLNVVLGLVVLGLILAITREVSIVRVEAAKVKPDEVDKSHIQRVDIDGVSCFVLDKYRGISCVVKP